MALLMFIFHSMYVILALKCRIVDFGTKLNEVLSELI